MIAGFLGEERPHALQSEAWVLGGNSLRQKVERGAVVSLLRQCGRQIRSDDGISGRLRLSNAEMANAGVKIAKLTLKGSEHRVQRARVAPIGQCSFTNADSFWHSSRARGGHGVADGGGGLVVENGNGSHAHCLAQLRECDSLVRPPIPDKEKGGGP